ncbi:hypothetical protein [Aquimonas sp.]|jgi:hypothetical protein|uniref:hypothetical protein n=1 Tax=Aquimonas sp. TaxID=1872588 RepID=UPI0037BE3B09
MSLADLDLFGGAGTAPASPMSFDSRRTPAVVDFSRVDTTPGAAGPFAPLSDMNDGKAYARYLRQISNGLLSQSFLMVAGWVCAPRPHTPKVTVTGPFADVFTECLKRFFAEVQR